MVNKDMIKESGNLAGSNIKEGAGGVEFQSVKESKTTIKPLSHEAAKADAKKTWPVKNSGNKSGKAQSET